MKIILDSNILFSALLRKSLTRKLILEYNGSFLFPSYIFHEIEKHQEELIRKSGMPKQHLNNLLNIILNKVEIVTEDKLKPYKDQAYTIIKDIDPNDTLFIACALAYPGSVIWSDDRKLKTQKKVRIVNTEEMASMIT